MLGATKLTKNTDPDKYSYSRYDIWFDSRSLFSNPTLHWDKNAVSFRANNCYSVHTDNKNKDILVLGECPTQGLHDTTITSEAKYSNSFSRLGKSCVSLHYAGDKSFLFVTATKIYQFKAKVFEMDSYPLCLEIISKNVTAKNVKKENRTESICIRFFC